MFRFFLMFIKQIYRITYYICLRDLFFVIWLPTPLRLKLDGVVFKTKYWLTLKNLPLQITQINKYLKFSICFQMARKKTEMESIVDAVWRGSIPSVVTTKTVLKLDILPLLPYILSPKLRNANVQVCSIKLWLFIYFVYWNFVIVKRINRCSGY